MYVKMDFIHKPLPELPLPNDVATRYDPRSPTLRRVNASMVAPTRLESKVRAMIDQLDGWGVLQPITIPFSGPIDVRSVLEGHRDADYRAENDVVFLIDVTPGSPHYGTLHPLDVGEGNYPVILEDIQGYWEHDPRGDLISLIFEERSEDLNGDGLLGLGEDLNGDGVLNEGEDLDGDGQLTPPEDLDADGVLDHPNYLPCALLPSLPCDAEGERVAPAWGDLATRADALMTFYERETNTLILRPLTPLRERSTYAVVITKRLLDERGAPVGSPFDAPYHISQHKHLSQIGALLPEGLNQRDVAFAFTFTTQTLSSDWVAVRDGLYGHGVQEQIGRAFPARLKRIKAVRTGSLVEGEHAYLMPTSAWINSFRLIATSLLGLAPSSEAFKAQLGAQEAIDYHVMTTFSSPQLFSRLPEGERTAHETQEAEQGEQDESERGDLVRPCEPEEPCELDQDDASRWRPLNEQAWPADLSVTPAEAYPEEVSAWVVMPKREAVEALYDRLDTQREARGEPLASEAERAARMTPVVLLGHGYGSTRFEALSFAGYFAKLGMATVAIDCPSHGIALNQEEQALALSLTERFGVRAFFEAAVKGRARDQDFDGRVDSGADFWTAYVFHTRDVVRQCVLDTMQLVRVLRSFDGERRWGFDLNGDGEPELAGDFNADGVVDLGLHSPLSAVGGSLGGITSALLASLEPEIDVAVPISGGGGLSDVGLRSLQGGVREAVILRVMGPLWLGVPADDPTQGTRVYTLAPELNDDGRRDLGHLPALKPYDTIVVENLTSGERGCAYVQEGGFFRVAVESDVGDEVRLLAYAGPQLAADGECGLREGPPEPMGVLDRFEGEVSFLGDTYAKDSSLRSIAEGFGEGRATPGLRRFLSLGQLVLDGGDPASYARHALLEPLTYPGAQQETGSHVLVVTTMGDMNVPASSGVTLGRAMGLIDYKRALPEQEGKTANQVLLETHTTEAVHSVGRHLDERGAPVHLDLELFSGGDDLWSEQGVPRLRTPLRAGLSEPDALGGYSGAIFPYAVPQGQHGFNFPGADRDLYIKRCLEACEEPPEGEAPSCEERCAEAYVGGFDVGYFFFNLLGDYLSAGGRAWAVKSCYADDSCLSERTPNPSDEPLTEEPAP